MNATARSGRGGPGIRLAPNPLPLATIIAYIRNPTGEMPPYGSKVLSDKDVVDIHAYLATIKAPPKLADIPEIQSDHFFSWQAGAGAATGGGPGLLDVIAPGVAAA